MAVTDNKKEEVAKEIHTFEAQVLLKNLEAKQKAMRTLEAGHRPIWQILTGAGVVSLAYLCINYYSGINNKFPNEFLYVSLLAYLLGAQLAFFYFQKRIKAISFLILDIKKEIDAIKTSLKNK